MSMSLVLSLCEMGKMIIWSLAEHISLLHLQPLEIHYVSFNLTHPMLSQHAFAEICDGCKWSLISHQSFVGGNLNLQHTCALQQRAK